MLILNDSQILRAEAIERALRATDVMEMVRFIQRPVGTVDWPLLTSGEALSMCSRDTLVDIISSCSTQHWQFRPGLDSTAERIISKVLSCEWDPDVYSFLVSGISPAAHFLAKMYRGDSSAKVVSRIGPDTLKKVCIGRRYRLGSVTCANVISLTESLLDTCVGPRLTDEQVLDTFVAVAYTKEHTGMCTYEGSSDTYGLKRFLGAGAESFSVLRALTTQSREELAELLLVHDQGSPMHVVASQRLQQGF